MRTVLAVAFAIVVVVVAAALVAFDSRQEAREWIDRWSVAEWAVALGTLLLACFTLYLAKQAQGQIEFQKQEAQDAARPIVYPLATHEWMRSGQKDQFVLIRNGGLGPALSVRGLIEWNAPAASPKPQTAVWPSGGLGPGEERLNYLARPGVENWHNARGALFVTGVDGRRWRTDFAAQIEERDIVVLRVAGIRELGPNDLGAL